MVLKPRIRKKIDWSFASWRWKFVLGNDENRFVWVVYIGLPDGTVTCNIFLITYCNYTAEELWDYDIWFLFH